MLRNLIRWARITKAGTDKEQFATQQMEYLGKVADGLIVFPYGIHGNVPPDALALMLAVQGSADNRAAIAWTPKDRPELKAGEVAFYHPPTDAFIIWKENGDLDIETGNGGTANININCKNVNLTASDNVNIECKQTNITASESVTLDTPETTITGNLTVQGNTSLSATVTSNGKDISDTHTHNGSPTAPSGPVSNTGTPV